MPMKCFRIVNMELMCIQVVICWVAWAGSSSQSFWTHNQMRQPNSQRQCQCHCQSNTQYYYWISIGHEEVVCVCVRKCIRAHKILYHWSGKIWLFPFCLMHQPFRNNLNSRTFQSPMWTDFWSKKFNKKFQTIEQFASILTNFLFFFSISGKFFCLIDSKSIESKYKNSKHTNWWLELINNSGDSRFFRIRKQKLNNSVILFSSTQIIHRVLLPWLFSKENERIERK